MKNSSLINKIFMIFSFVFCVLFLCSCNEPNKPFEFNDEVIVVNMNGTAKINYVSSEEVISKKFYVEDEEIAIYSGGYIIGLSIGETILYCQYNDTEIESVKIEVVDKEEFYIDVKDVQKNKEVYSELMHDLSLFDEKVKKSNEFIINYENITNDNIEKQSIKVSNEPVYVEVKIDDKYVIANEEKNGIFTYLIDGKNVKRTYIGSLGQYDEAINQKDSFLTIEFDPEKGNIEKRGNVYTLVSHYEDAVIEEFKSLVTEICTLLNVPLSEFGKYVVVRNVTVLENKINIDINFTFKLNYNGINKKIKIRGNQEIAITSFDKIDIFNGEYNISDPTSMIEIYETTNIDDSVKLEGYGESYAKMDLQKGVLLINVDGSYDNDNKIFTLYDSNGEHVEGVKYTEFHNIYNELKKMICIPETGTYYLRATNNLSGDAILTFENYGYDDIMNLNSPIPIVDNEVYEGKIEGKYDSILYFYNNETDGTKSLKVKNTGEYPIYFYNLNNQNVSEKSITKVAPDKTVYLKLEKGENNIMICNMFPDNELEHEKYDFQFNAKLSDVSLEGDIHQLEINEKYYISDKGMVYFSLYLKPGQYFLSSNKLNNIVLRMYNENNELINDDIVSDYTYLFESQKLIIVEEEGNYFFSFYYYGYGDEFWIEKLEYSTIFDKNNPTELNEKNVVQLEGNVDFEYFHTFDSSVNNKYKITNTGEEIFYILCKESNSSYYMFHEVKPNESYEISKNRGVIEFYLTNNMMYQQYELEYYEEPIIYSFAFEAIK